MSKKIITIFAILTIVTLLGIISLESKRAKKENQNIEEIVNSENPIYYYGIDCPYCRELEKFLEENKIEEKITIVKKEVYQNKQNTEEIASVAKFCGLSTNEIGLPFVYAEKKCMLGLVDIINYIKEKTGLENSDGEQDEDKKNTQETSGEEITVETESNPED